MGSSVKAEHRIFPGGDPSAPPQCVSAFVTRRLQLWPEGDSGDASLENVLDSVYTQVFNQSLHRSSHSHLTNGILGGSQKTSKESGSAF